jgi:hypothetical protein
MDRNVLFEAFKNLNLEDQVSLGEMVRNHIDRVARSRAFRLKIGQKVSFVSRTGATISGTFSRMKQKYAEVISDQDRYGRSGPGPSRLRWSVSPALLKIEEA